MSIPSRRPPFVRAFGPLLFLGLAGCLAPAEPGSGSAPGPSDLRSTSAPETAPAAVSAEPPAPSQEQCEAVAAWVERPSRPDASAFNGSTNCAFHQWAFQTFLWLTSPLDPANPTGPLQVDMFASPYDLFPSDGKGPSRPFPGRASGAGSHMLARTAKSGRTVDPTDIFQAGPGKKVLVDQKGQVVYYSMLLDHNYWDYVVQFKLYLLDILKSEGPNSPTMFPSGALELKLSWRVAARLDAAGERVEETYIADAAQRFHVIKAQIPGVVAVDGTVVDHQKVSWANMALVGMHVTGVVADHPEFIWATFEHVDNAPDCDKVRTQKPGAGAEWSFYRPGTPDTACNQTDPGAPLAPSNVCRLTPTAAAVEAQPCAPDDPSQAQRDNDRNIFALNQGVRAQLRARGSVWANYTLVGAQWTTGRKGANTGIPDNHGKLPAPNLFQKGSCALANTTMETFTQDENCFSCHNAGGHIIDVKGEGTEVNGKPLNLSHFIVNYQADQQARRESP